MVYMDGNNRHRENAASSEVKILFNILLTLLEYNFIVAIVL